MRSSDPGYSYSATDASPMLTASAVFAIRVTGAITYLLSRIFSKTSSTRKMALEMPMNSPKFRQTRASATSSAPR